MNACMQVDIFKEGEWDMGGLNNKYVNADLKWCVYQPVFSVINILVIFRSLL